MYIHLLYLYFILSISSHYRKPKNTAFCCRKQSNLYLSSHTKAHHGYHGASISWLKHFLSISQTEATKYTQKWLFCRRIISSKLFSRQRAPLSAIIFSWFCWFFMFFQSEKLIAAAVGEKRLDPPRASKERTDPSYCMLTPQSLALITSLWQNSPSHICVSALTFGPAEI